ncbi:hypothetical protein [Nocardioides luteus]|uniref:hypothetical protein n=1 Tax=Nocardioides luteus TaxID=1844 RepID=UPI00115FA69D|nr:hypothetical protein [Nocardioides luteus]
MANNDWNRGVFDATIERFEHTLADLHAIDAFIATVKATREQAIPGGEIDNLYTAGGGEKVVMTVGRIHEFEMDLGWFPTPGSATQPSVSWPASTSTGPVGHWESEFKKALAECNTNGKEYAANLVGYVRDATKYLVQPVAPSFESAASTISETEAAIEVVATQDLLELTNSVSDWEGDAADAFFNYTYGHIQPAGAIHSVIAAALNCGLTSAHQIVSISQDALMQIVRGIDDAIMQQLDARAADWQADPPPSTAETVGLGSAGVGVIAALLAIPTGGTSLALAAGLMGAAAAAGGMAASAASLEGSERVALSAATAVEIGDELFNRVSDVLTWNRAKWDELEGGLTGIVKIVTENESSLAPRTPDVGRVDPGDWHHESVNS